MKKFISLAIIAAAILFAVNPAMAAEGAEAVAKTPWGSVAAGISLAFAAAFGAIGQGKAIVAACEGIARNPGATGNIRTTLLIGLAFIESLVLYVLVIAFAIK